MNAPGLEEGRCEEGFGTCLGANFRHDGGLPGLNQAPIGPFILDAL